MVAEIVEDGYADTGSPYATAGKILAALAQQAHKPGLAAYDEAKAAGKLGSECVAAYIAADRAQQAHRAFYEAKPMFDGGVPVPYDDLTQSIFDDLAASVSQQAQPEDPPENIYHELMVANGEIERLSLENATLRSRMDRQAQPEMPTREQIARAIWGEGRTHKDGGGSIITFDTCHESHRNACYMNADDVLALFNDNQ